MLLVHSEPGARKELPLLGVPHLLPEQQSGTSPTRDLFTTKRSGLLSLQLGLLEMIFYLPDLSSNFNGMRQIMKL
ncbi:hypothetical protein AKJ16_DCAP14502 [Drosera capensis]